MSFKQVDRNILEPKSHVASETNIGSVKFSKQYSIISELTQNIGHEKINVIDVQRKRFFLVLLIFFFIPLSAYGQFSSRDYKQGVVGLSIWFDFNWTQVDDPPDTASKAVKGYIEVLPSSIPGQGYSFGISMGHWGVNIGRNDGKVDIDQYADVNQTPNDKSDDVKVKSAKRSGLTYNIIYHPLSWFYVGAGGETGKMEFEQTNPDGNESTENFSYGNEFVSIGMAFGIDPGKSKFGVFGAGYVKVPKTKGAFTGNVFGIGFGFFF